jgi:CRP/FNR family transcriptional regulator
MKMATQWWRDFPALRSIADPHWLDLMASAQELRLPPGTTVFQAGESCQSYLIVLEGVVRVAKLAENGREIVLYRVEGGETCVLTTSCLMASERYPAFAVTETAVHAVALPVERFHQALANADFRSFVFAAFGSRMADLMTLIEAIALQRTDARLAKRLTELVADNDIVTATHYDLAADLGTAREVVSRLLKEFEYRGWLKLGRGQLVVTDRAALGVFANEHR